MESFKTSAMDLLSFIEKSPSCYHVIENLKKELNAGGFEELSEESSWDIHPGGAYYVTRADSSLCAFRIPGNNSFDGSGEKGVPGFRVIASHSDSPSFKIKENPEIHTVGLIKLNIEKYGGMLCAPWFDRPLSAAGRILIREKTEKTTTLRSKLVNIDRDLLMIPSLAIHMDRSANEGHRYNPQIDMLPLLGEESFSENIGKDGNHEKERMLKKIAAEAAGVPAENIVSMDLFLYSRVKPSIWGANEEFISSPKLDDLACCRTSFHGFMNSKGSDSSISMFCVFDNEEVGSGTRQGAASTFLADTMQRIYTVLGETTESYHRSIAQSFLVSADNGHAQHPNYPEKSDPVNHPRMNGGIVIKHSANQKYTTDAVSEAICREVCEQAEIPCQIFTNRADMPGGSTLGNLSAMQVPILSVDIGMAQLAMHSPYETGGIKDPYYMEKFAEAFYNAKLCIEKGTWTVER